MASQIAKTAANCTTGATTASNSTTQPEQTPAAQSEYDTSSAPPQTALQPHPQGPTPAPAAFPQDSTTSAPTTPPLSPYTSHRQRLRELTMPLHPNFSIPASPPRPSSPDSLASLAATTKKFDRFLDLKRKGVHFNARLQTSTSLRNPSLLPKLMEFAGVGLEDSYRSTLGEEVGGVPVRWGEGSYVENLVKENERWRKRKLKEREKVEFVGAKTGGSSVSGTPKAGQGGKGKGTLVQPKKASRFDRR